MNINQLLLQGQGFGAGEDLSRLSDEELAAIVNGTPAPMEKMAAAQARSAFEAEEIAAAQLSGQIMAHAYEDESNLIKLAYANGLCRICKSRPYAAGATTCTSCAGG